MALDIFNQFSMDGMQDGLPEEEDPATFSSDDEVSLA